MTNIKAEKLKLQDYKQLIDIYVGECEECNCSGSENDDYNQSDVSVDLLSED